VVSTLKSLKFNRQLKQTIVDEGVLLKEDKGTDPFSLKEI